MQSTTNDGWLSVIKNHLKRKRTPLEENKLRFISGINHELRGPLNGITGLTWLLEGTKLTEEQRQYIASLRHSTDDLLRMLNDMVDMARLEAGHLDCRPTSVLIEEVVEFIFETHSMAVAARNIRLRSKLAFQLQAPVWCDPARLQQVLLGLLQVAIKSSSQTVLELKARVEENPGRKLRFEITDEVNGFSVETLNRIQALMEGITIKDRYVHGPLGHSLCVSKFILESMGGKMGVVNSAIKAALWFELPIDNSNPDLQSKKS